MPTVLEPSVKENLTVNQPSANGAPEVYYPESDGKPMGETDYHITLITDLLQMLRNFLRDRADAYVAADLMFYYEQGNAKRVVAPDVIIVLNSHKTPRAIYKLWEEAVPSVVIEVASQKTWERDLNFKKSLYQRLGIAEYYIVDPTPGDKELSLPAPLIAYRLSPETNRYRLQEIKNNRVFSPALNLEFVMTKHGLKLFDAVRNKFLRSASEAEIDARKAEISAREAEIRAREVDAENERLRREIARLTSQIQTPKSND